jgi:hypothetical protein
MVQRFHLLGTQRARRVVLEAMPVPAIGRLATTVNDKPDEEVDIIGRLRMPQLLRS